MTAPCWRVDETAEHDTVVVDPGDNIVATVHVRGPPDRHDAALRYRAEILASAPDMLSALYTLRMNADLHIELGHATVASETFRERVYGAAGTVLARIEQAREGDNTRRPPRADRKREDE